ncbi:MAG: extracellular solute-binding protein [Planctomycetaceae bacterium]|nr:extracellular solute-binding protein [Planctomycetaceae bacterium]
MRNRVSLETDNFRRRVGLIGRLLGLFVAVWGGGGCGPSQPEVVVYCALDAEFAQPILDEFQRQSGIRVLAKFDVESTKTVGLANALIAEANRPRADIFWNNEIIHTTRLARLGLLAPYEPVRADEYPAEFRAADHTWHGFAARARVLLVNTQLVAENERPRRLDDLTAAQWRGTIGIAKPLFGTTATHAACLFAKWGEARTQKFFRQLKQNEVQILAGNKPVAQAVSAGRIAIGLTDTDDAIAEVEAGHPVAIVYPDRGPSDEGTLFIPNTLAVIRDAPHRAAAEQLVDFLLSPEVERKLAVGPSAQIPLHPAAQDAARIATPATIKPLTVDFKLAGELWESTARFLREEFTGGP